MPPKNGGGGKKGKKKGSAPKNDEDEDDLLIKQMIDSNAKNNENDGSRCRGIPAGVQYREVSLDNDHYVDASSPGITGLSKGAMVTMFCRSKCPSAFDSLVHYSLSDLNVNSNQKGLYAAFKEVVRTIEEHLASDEDDQIARGVYQILDVNFSSLGEIKVRHKPGMPSVLFEQLNNAFEEYNGITEADEKVEPIIEEISKLLTRTLAYDVKEEKEKNIIVKLYMKLSLLQVLWSKKTFEDVTLSQIMQLNAARIASLFGGWKHSPDSVMVRGLAFFLRGQLTESIHDLNQVLKWKSKNSNWIELADGKQMGQMLATNFLELARGELKPCRGNFIELMKSKGDSTLGERSIDIHTLI